MAGKSAVDQMYIFYFANSSTLSKAGKEALLKYQTGLTISDTSQLKKEVNAEIEKLHSELALLVRKEQEAVASGDLF